ncbi:MAG: hypothetical protein HOP30_21475 [Cyclobacteriaceae bacterium]|nr:hypothetical protein [Cyclobacteriaceae bacterium]
MNRIIISFAIVMITSAAVAQTSTKNSLNFGNPILIDSASMLLIPTIYEVSMFTSNKLAFWGNYYSNIIFYNFKTDVSKRLFAKDTYIVSLEKADYRYDAVPKLDKTSTNQWIFYKVLNVDRNRNNKIDDEDPTVLYVSDTHGDNLKALTSEEENVKSFQMYEKQNIALVKIQRDMNKDGKFTDKDTDFYFIKLDLTTLAFGSKIEMN